MKRRTFPATRLVLGLAAAVSIVLLARAHTLASGGIFAEPTQPTDGTTTHCDDFRLLLNLGFFSLDVGGLYDPTDEGWVWIEPEGRHFRSISGVSVSSGVTNKDTPANHDSHDHTNDVRVDVGQEDRLSIVN